MKEMKQNATGCIFVMDNHRIHKSGELRDMIQKEGIRILYLPPCSEQLNPIFFFYQDFYKKLFPLLRNYDNQSSINTKTLNLLI
jgi:hypothetical protein